MFHMLQCVGVGKMRPNVVFLGFKNDWLNKPQATIDYFNIIHDALDLQYGVGILRLQSGLDFSDFFGLGTISLPMSIEFKRSILLFL
jgi:solute carrier family 12 (sodium/potassium/chloride transporter), member 2